MWYFVLIPIVWVIITKLIWHKDINLHECGLHLVSVIPITMLICAIGYYSATSDTLLIHGKVTEKIRDNDQHEESYSCNCRTVYSGSGNNRTSRTECDTCYRTVYTVDWYLKSTIGNIGIDSERSYYSSVWNTPDPLEYIQAYVDEPCSDTRMFTNYIKASSNSLFNTDKYVLTDVKLSAPEYPRIHSIYKVNNVLNVNTKVDIKPYEDLLSDKLKTLGAKKEANIIIIFANTNDKRYRYVVEKAWLGGKKNDIVFIIGTTDNRTIEWADGFTFGLSQGNFLMLATALDNIRGKQLSPQIVVNSITDSVDKSFVRKKMEDFKYLTKEIAPSGTLLWIVFVLQLLSNIGITFWCIRNDFRFNH